LFDTANIITMSKELPPANTTPRKIQLDETEGFQQEGFDGHVYIPSDAGLGFNVLSIDVHGSHPRKRTVGDTTRNYYVIDGTGSFTLGDTSTDVQMGDLFVIPPDGEYEYKGEMRLLEVNVSPSNNFQDEKLT
jgi:mannose-6-phosphate isomerase-like protein (cupin superfamily)